MRVPFEPGNIVEDRKKKLTMKIDYTKLDNGIVRTITAVENKAHVKYIRYLLTKRLPPLAIKKELARLALSAPDKATLVCYFVNIMWPVIVGYGLSEIYKEYLDRLVKTEFEKDVSPTLKFDISIPSPDSRISFCLFVTELEIDDMWSAEIVRYFGGVENIPQDVNGVRVITTTSAKSVESVLTCPRKHVVDQLLLENVSPSRISLYMLEKYQIKLDVGSLYSYSKHFFNFERRGLEEIINNLVVEKQSIKSDLDILDSNADYSLGDKIAIASQYKEKIAFLDNCILGLNAQYSDVTYRQGIVEKLSMEDMVSDIVRRGYDRFVMLDRFKDRDAVKPLGEVSKIIFSGIDKARALDQDKERAVKTTADRDRSSSEVILTLYQKSYEKYRDEILANNPQAALLRIDDEDSEIFGVDEN